ncbi:SRPBCC family protein [Nonomuraea fuscirosea]|uniref:SRPBCC family protein n=1 Tax=Nonomuraea fuscirosea TaxID=1291556 RepID=UPI0033D79DD1
MNAFRRLLVPLLLLKAAALAAYLLLIRPRLLRWGATRGETTRPLPGDDIVPRPHVAATRAITIDAPPEAVWPWLAQMGGHPRAGWYAYDHITNDDYPSADQILPGLQRLHVGDLLPTPPVEGGYTVERIVPGRELVLAIRAFHVTVSWAIVLLGDEEHTRLLFRQRLHCRPGLPGLVYLLLSESADFLITRRQLTTIKTLAEKAAHKP